MIIGITGRIASGKESVLNFFEEENFTRLNVSDAIINEMVDRGIKVIRKNIQDFGNLIREQEGGGAWIKRLLEKQNVTRDNFIINGIRNPGEIEELKKYKDFFLISVDAPQEQRFKRLMKRKKPSDPKNREEFLIIDNRDFGEEDPMGQQVSKCMELADYKLINDSSFENFRKQIEETWNKLKKKVNEDSTYRGVVIAESLEDKSILKELKIIGTRVEKVTTKHKTPWIKKWTLHTTEIPEDKASEISEKISKALDSKHNWYADYKNNKYHYIIFKGKVFCIDKKSKEEYDKAREYGILLGIPEYQVAFHPEVID